MAVLYTAPLQYVASTPPVTRAFTATTIAMTLLYYFLWWRSEGVFSVPYLVLVPGDSLYHPWTLLTSVFVETSIIEFAFTLLTVPASLRYLERLWGAVETMKFIAVTVVVSNTIAVGLCLIEYIVLGNTMFLYGQWYHGQMTVQIGVLVAFTQIIPEHQVQLFGAIRARVKSIPMAYLTFSTVMCLLGFQCPYIVIQFGWLVAYIWLRFYKKNTDVGSGGPAYGDRSETFAFINWFPPFAHTPLTILSNTSYSVASKFHLIPGAADLESGNYTQLPGSARAEAERRRAMALKALDQRMAGASSPAPRSAGVPAGSNPSVPVPANGTAAKVDDVEIDIGASSGGSQESR